ncbi:MAG: malate dehydrogenase [Acidobacteriota bacterium]
MPDPARRKISLIGAGNIGGTMAHLVVEKELGDVVLFDVVEGIPQGKALDLMEMRPVGNHDVRVTGTNDWPDCKNTDLFIVTAGIARKPGMSRDDLLATNTRIMNDVATHIREVAPAAFIIVISNPLDAMVTLCKQVTGFPKARVMGMAGALDTARFRHFVAEEMSASVENVVAVVLGGHGDDMVPLPRYCSVAGIPLQKLLTPERIEAICSRTRMAGGEIVKHLKTGSAFYSPAACAVHMAESILRDRKWIVPCAVLLEGEYGVDGLFVGVPVTLGAGGVEKIHVLELNPEEREAFDRSVLHVRQLVASLKN